MGVVFFIVNIVCLAVLVRCRYHKLFPLFLGAQTLTVWQAFVRIFVATDNRWEWIHYWAPGEALLLIATGAAVLESIWRSVQQLSRRARLLTFYGLILFACSLVFAVHSDGVTGQLYDRFLNHRTWLYLMFAILAFCGFWLGICTNHVWPRVARMHMTLYATLMISHVSFGSWTVWEWSNKNYRWLEMLCCVGWCINSGFLARELSAVQKSLDGFQQRMHDSDLRLSQDSRQIVQVGRIAFRER